MTQIANYSSTAERERGLIFAENFISNDEIIRNGGVIVGTIASYPTLSGVKTVVAKLKQADSVSNTVKLNAGNTITITAGNTFGSFTSVGGILADDIEVDDYAKFEYLRIFKNELTAQEITDYQNNSIYNYFNDVLAYFPLDSTKHDPDNARTLDFKGASNLTFGNGVTSTTFPAKLKERGYSTDGGDSLRFAGNPFSASDTSCTVMLLLRGVQYSTTQCFFSIEQTTTDTGIGIFALSNGISFFSGSAAAGQGANFSVGAINSDKLFCVVGQHNSATNITRIFVNGSSGTNAVSPAAPGFTNLMTTQLLIRGNFITQPAVSGTKILELAMWNTALTDMQIHDLTFKTLSLYNQT